MVSFSSPPSKPSLQPPQPCAQVLYVSYHTFEFDEIGNPCLLGDNDYVSNLEASEVGRSGGTKNNEGTPKNEVYIDTRNMSAI